MSKKVIILLSLSLLIGVFVSNFYSGNLIYDLKTIGLSVIGILIGFIISAYGLILNSLASFTNELKNSLNIDNEIKISIFNNTKLILKELKENILFMIITLIVFFFIIIFYNLDIPYLYWPITHQFISKASFCEGIFLGLLFLNLYTIFDSLQALFKIYDHSQIMHEKKFKE